MVEPVEPVFDRDASSAVDRAGSMPSGPSKRSDASAPLREVLERLGGKWSLLVIGALGDERKRFGELRRGLGGVSQRMLTLTLRSLERDGIVARTLYPTAPLRVEYELTRIGVTLLEPLAALAAWAERNRATLHEARKRYDTRMTRETSAANRRGRAK
jgi:DNA-binding HxlR family transcriptional regulator